MTNEIEMNDGFPVLYANLITNTTKPYMGLVIPKCPFCTNRHIHSMEEGHRVSHCFDKKTGQRISGDGYHVLIDWSNPKNEALRDRYERLIKAKKR